MNNNSQTNYATELRKIFWPIETNEYKKFIPMAAMMFCILFNYSMLRSIKDGFVVTNIGPEAISFLKTYIVLPSAVLAMIIYAKLCNIVSQQKVFYYVTSFFLIYIALFAFVLYPNPELIHPNPEVIKNLTVQYPSFKWFIRIAGQWSFASLYTISELWGGMMMSLLFWQFANQITKTEEAKRFYSMFGLIGNFALPLTALFLMFFLSDEINIVPQHLKFIPLFIATIISGITTMALYWWINKNVLTDPALYDPNNKKAKKSKAKLSLMDSFKLIFSSKYLGLIALLIIAYGMSINLVEVIWKAKVGIMYPTKEAYTKFMANFQALQGIAAIIFMVIGSNILKRVSWSTAAILTPLMILITGLGFFSFILFDNVIAMYATGILASEPLKIAIMLGLVQNVLSKATKYSLFDSTKEMAYIPLDDELKTKGKAAVDVVGGRLGKSSGGIIQSTIFMLFPLLSFDQATPYFAGIFFVVVILWLYAVKALGKEYHNQLLDNSY